MLINCPALHCHDQIIYTQTKMQKVSLSDAIHIQHSLFWMCFFNIFSVWIQLSCPPNWLPVQAFPAPSPPSGCLSSAPLAGGWRRVHWLILTNDAPPHTLACTPVVQTNCCCVVWDPLWAWTQHFPFPIMPLATGSAGVRQWPPMHGPSTLPSITNFIRDILEKVLKTNVRHVLCVGVLQIWGCE